MMIVVDMFSVFYMPCMSQSNGDVMQWLARDSLIGSWALASEENIGRFALFSSSYFSEHDR
jgi:hypothetical protein